jgi:hypothetical protein
MSATIWTILNKRHSRLGNTESLLNRYANETGVGELKKLLCNGKGMISVSVVMEFVWKAQY